MLEDPIARLFGALYDMEHQGLISFLERGIVKGFIAKIFKIRSHNSRVRTCFQIVFSRG
ncbi:hypothetical protein pb186bvf_012966 [Paramecium bursaria]